MDWQAIIGQIVLATGKNVQFKSVQPVFGGDISTAFYLHGQGVSYFVKLNRVDLLAMFAAEFDSLQAIANTQTLRVPEPVVYGRTAEHAFLVLQYLELYRVNGRSEALFGQQLARLHQQVQPYFGWHQDNTIGTTAQINTPSHDWSHFWREQRLQPQLKLAENQGGTRKLLDKGARLCADMSALFSDYLPESTVKPRPKETGLYGAFW